MVPLPRLAWALMSNEVEAAGPRLRPRLLCACVMIAISEPKLVRNRWFVKTILCASGVWTLVARLRRLSAMEK